MLIMMIMIDVGDDGDDITCELSVLDNDDGDDE